MLKHKVVLVPMENMTLDVTGIENPLNNIYRPYAIEWEVSLANEFTDRSWDENNDGLQSSGSGFFSEFTPEMRGLNQVYASKAGVDNESLYLFVFNSTFNDPLGINLQISKTSFRYGVSLLL